MPFRTRCARVRTVGTLPILGFVFEDMLGLEASYRVAFAIANEKKTHATVECLIKP